MLNPKKDEKTRKDAKWDSCTLKLLDRRSDPIIGHS